MSFAVNFDSVGELVSQAKNGVAFMLKASTNLDFADTILVGFYRFRGGFFYRFYCSFQKTLLANPSAEQRVSTSISSH